jgi:hypothetical protein
MNGCKVKGSQSYKTQGSIIIDKANFYYMHTIPILNIWGF